MDYLINVLEQRIPVDIVYLDFRKAFDSVLYTWLFIKLQAYGICEDLYNWLCDYLTERKQQVVLNGESST